MTIELRVGPATPVLVDSLELLDILSKSHGCSDWIKDVQERLSVKLYQLEATSLSARNSDFAGLQIDCQLMSDGKSDFLREDRHFRFRKDHRQYSVLRSIGIENVAKARC